MANFSPLTHVDNPANIARWKSIGASCAFTVFRGAHPPLPVGPFLLLAVLSTPEEFAQLEPAAIDMLDVTLGQAKEKWFNLDPNAPALDEVKELIVDRCNLNASCFFSAHCTVLTS